MHQFSEDTPLLVCRHDCGEIYEVVCFRNAVLIHFTYISGMLHKPPDLWALFAQILNYPFVFFYTFFQDREHLNLAKLVRCHCSMHRSICNTRRTCRHTSVSGILVVSLNTHQFVYRFIKPFAFALYSLQTCAYVCWPI